MEDNLVYAQKKDQLDPLAIFKNQFFFPKNRLYFAGHSLGLMPKKVVETINEELDAWKNLAVAGHFQSLHPWFSYHEEVTKSLARLVGAKESEVVAMNTLTINLHLMMISFYRPKKSRFKILIENHTFPSDKYAVDSQVEYHGFNPQQAVITLGENEEIKEIIEKNKDELALILLGNVNYLTGQYLPIEEITKFAHKYEIPVGFNLAHGAGNLLLRLHDWEVDFAVWCSYKYLNAGPGGIGCAFVHERHHLENLPKLKGWWGHDKSRRFLMECQFQGIKTVESWQVSNPSILSLACLRASLSLFDEAGMENLQKKSYSLTGYLEFLLQKRLGDKIKIVTPADRGSMLTLKIPGKNELTSKLEIDFRMPDIFRMTPVPLYNSYEDVYKLVELLEETLH